ncbi:MAG: lysophospholipid acyltransferase family protein [Pyrinomonadaceae bacterium]
MTPINNPYPPPSVMKFIRGFGYFLGKIVWQMKFHGIENIPRNLPGGLVVAPNHQTYVDAFWVIIPLKRNLRFMAWDKIFNVFGIGRVIRYLGAFPVNIERGDKEAYQKSVEVLREGATLVIFPEGSRAFADGKLLDFKTGAVRMAIEAGVPILPVTIRGANKVWAREMKYPRAFRKIEIIYHPLFEVSPPAAGVDSREHARELTEQLKQIIQTEAHA